MSDNEDDGKMVSLELSQLPSADGTCSYSHDLKFPSLRKLEIYACPKLDISSLLNGYKKHWNLSLPSYSRSSSSHCVLN